MGRVWPNPDDPYEPYWLETDVEKALAFVHAQSEVCQRCGTREEDWIDGEGYPLDPPIYIGSTHRCHGCATLEQVSDTIPDKERGVCPTFERYSRPQQQF